MQNRCLLAVPLFFLTSFLPLPTSHASHSVTSVQAEGQSVEKNYFQSSELMMDAEVSQLKHLFLSSRRRDLEVALGRAPLYFSVLEDYLRQAGLPNAFKYIPVVESELKPAAISPNGAAGLWQIMPSTGRSYGLQIDRVVDERLDLHLSTQAATRYLADLQTEFCDWMLALAAYNCGPGKVRSAMRKAQSGNYVQLKQYLPRQTQRYVARFLAFAQLSETYEQPGIKCDVAMFQAEATMAIHLDGRVSLPALAALSGVSLDIIQRLNPAFKSGELPIRDAGWRVELPQEAVGRYFKQRAVQEEQRWMLKEKAVVKRVGNLPLRPVS